MKYGRNSFDMLRKMILNQLKDVKTPAEIKAKIDKLINGKKTLSLHVVKLKNQRNEMLGKLMKPKLNGGIC